jgi:ABC-type nitrate/sulfonate/bicarbonate transport system permease component
VSVRRWLSPAIVVGALSLAAVVALYWLVATRPGTNAALVPTPPTIMKTFGEELASGDLWINTRASLTRVVIGYAIGASLALVLGALAGWFKGWGYVLNPIIDALAAVAVPYSEAYLAAGN